MATEIRAAAIRLPETADTDPFYIRGTAALVDDRSFVLKHGDTFAVFDHYGDIRSATDAQDGLYHEGTRFLSRSLLRLGLDRGLLLSSAVSEDNSRVVVDLSNADVFTDGTIILPRGVVHLSRLLVLWDGVLYQRITLHNYSSETVVVPLVVGFDADFADVFEVRGTKRARRGQVLAAELNDSGITLGYRGLDDVVRRMCVSADPPPAKVSPTSIVFQCDLAAGSKTEYNVTFACELGASRSAVGFTTALDRASEYLEAGRAESCEIVTSNQPFNEWLRRSQSDLAMMASATPYGRYPYAGVPWFSTPFGRDGLITALECLWANPAMAAGVLTFLAATQARETKPEQDSQPGKILHEMRSGEMAALGEIPFGRYYGSHDATPLFVMLAAAYYRRTADLDLIRGIWPAIEAALHWIEHDGDLDGDGFIEYARQSPTGLVQQGWKDSHDGVFNANGEIPPAPIALCEIQAYVYEAWLGASALARALGREADAERWAQNASAMRERFEAHFWDPDLGTYVLALDGQKRPCAVRTSNAGHALYTGIAAPDRAAIVAQTLLAPESFSGWGIRTAASSESRYNPMSYHCGSIWPHDNALIAAGFSRYGLQQATTTVIGGLFDASRHMHLHRLPELFCGFRRRAGNGPTGYPVACNPQAWASASVLLLVQAALGLDVDAVAKTVRFTRARLPNFIDRLQIRRLRVGPVTLDVELERHEHNVGVAVLSRDGDVEIVSIK